MLKKKIYQWHRTCSLVIAIPVLLWAASGFMHPIMTNIRPNIATQFMTASVVDTNRVRVSMQQALRENHIDSIKSFRFIHIDTNWFYQIRTSTSSIEYLSVSTGKCLNKGDWLYAQYLARYFLEGNATGKKEADDISTTNPNTDCCDAAAVCVLKPAKGCKVSDVKLVNSFDHEYKSINRLLPVYRVDFERADGVRIYVETTQDRFAFAMDNKRAVFTSIFAALHTWDWGEGLGAVKIIAQMFFVGLAFITSLMGIYIFFTTQSKKVIGNTLVKARRNHRFTSIVIVLFTLMFTFSGFYHALSKFEADTRDKYFVSPDFAAADLAFDVSRLSRITHMPVTNVNIIRMNDSSYWQVFVKPFGIAKKQPASKDLMKEMSVPKPSVAYVNMVSQVPLKDGERRYAHYLANTFSGKTDVDVKADSVITKFNDEYNFTDKRLPVWKIQYADNHNERYYVETSTGKLSKRINDRDLYEGYSFALFHKHHFMDFAGKSWRDFSTMFWAAAQIAMVIIGLILYFRFRRRQRSAKTE